MDERLPHDTLLAWALGTFHATLFLVALVLLAYGWNILADALGALDTLRGLALFGALWLLSWWGARRTLRDLGGAYASRDVLRKGGFWGGVTGAGFLVALLTLLLAPVLPEVGFEALPFLALALTFGSAFAFLVGALVGLALAALDLLLLALARRLLSGRPPASTG